MDYRVEALARAAAVTVDTVRFYQAQRLLPAPRRVGRHAVYSEKHLARLRRIKRLQCDGIPLAVIRRLVDPQARRPHPSLFRALADEQGKRTLTREALASESGVPPELITAVEQAGLVEPVRVGGAPRYGHVDVELARSALRILREGFPLAELLALAIHQADGAREVVDRAIELFDRHVRHDASGAERPAEEVVDAFRRLLPAATALVAHHFHHTLVARALARLERLGDRDGLEHALAATTAGRLEVTWR